MPRITRRGPGPPEAYRPGGEFAVDRGIHEPQAALQLQQPPLTCDCQGHPSAEARHESERIRGGVSGGLHARKGPEKEEKLGYVKPRSTGRGKRFKREWFADGTATRSGNVSAPAHIACAPWASTALQVCAVKYTSTREHRRTPTQD